jgi:thiamine biosynthesis lipoprotein ApbE
MNAMAAGLMAPATTQVALDVPSMGGRLRMRVTCATDERTRAEHELRSLARRVDRWAARLTRFAPTSELCALNADPAAAQTRVGPTLGAILDWAADAGRRTRGTVDVTLLEERLAAEEGVEP